MRKLFFEAIGKLNDPEMGTENVGFLLYSLVMLLRPRMSMALGMGQSTLYILEALHAAKNEYHIDRKILAAESESGRKNVLYDAYYQEGEEFNPQLHAVDDCSQKGKHIDGIQSLFAKLGYNSFLQFHPMRFEDFDATVYGAGAFDLIWTDFGHQIDYPAIINKVWPSLADGGLLIVHYTYIDLPFAQGGATESVVLSGPVANALKKQMLSAGIESGFEFLSLVEPHKFRQGSVSILRKVPVGDRCRNSNLSDEMFNLYGVKGESLANLHET